VNPNTLKQHFRAEARRRGVQFDDRRLARRSEVGSEGIRVTCDVFAAAVDEDTKRSALTGQSVGAVGQVTYLAKRVVNCAGPWAPAVAKLLGYPCPSKPVRRQVCIFDCRDVDLSPYGMIIDTSGVYFHPEATNGLSGFANRDEPAGFNFAYQGESFFEEVIWPALYERSSKFERLRHLTGWAGLYEVSPDESAILGEAQGGTALSQGRIFEAHSFSGHGAMHSHAAGLAIAEKMVAGKYLTIDAQPLSAARFDGGVLLHEGLVI
jgi:FAD-dependent oxidoreductase domain-containing protein 1